MIRTAITALAAGTVAFACVAPSSSVAAESDALHGIRMGLVASSPAVAGVSEIERAYSRALGVPVTVFVARDLPTLIEAQVNSYVEYAIYSAAAYAVAWKLCECIEPIVAPTGIDGTHGIKAVLIRRKSASSVAPSADAPVAVSPDSVGAPALFDDAGAGGQPQQGANAAEAERQFISGERNTLQGWVADRPVGGIDPASGTLARLFGEGMDADDFEIAWSSDTIPFGPHAVRKDLPDGLKSRLRDFLANMKLAYPDLYEFVEAERQGGFARVSHGDYLPAVAMVEGLVGRETAAPRP